MEARAGNLYNRKTHPIGAPEHNAPIPPARTYVPRADGSMLSSIPISPEAATARNQPNFHASVQHQMARERAHPEASFTSSGPSADAQVAGVGVPAFMIFLGALAILYAMQ